MTFVFLPVVWYVTDKIKEPRLGTYLADGAQAVAAGMTTAAVNEGDVSEAEISQPLSPDQRKSLRDAGLTTLGVVALWPFMMLGPSLIDETASPEAQLTPFINPSSQASWHFLSLPAGRMAVPRA